MIQLKKIEEIAPMDDVITETITGIFSVLSDDTTYPLVADFIKSDNNQYLTLDIDYLLQHSSHKYLSSFTQKFYEKVNEDVNTLFGAIATMVYQRFGVKWKKIWDALNTTYKPLENYSMKDVRTPDITRQIDGNDSISTDAKTGIYGYNSVADVPSSTSEGTQENENSRTETETGTETTERTGNIGVTTSQQMLQSEFEVRKYDFYNMMYDDIDSILCLKSY